MIRRNGGVAKVVFGVCVFFVGVYLFYLYYDVSGRLKQTERTAERYRREGETASAQLQGNLGFLPCCVFNPFFVM